MDSNIYISVREGEGLYVRQNYLCRMCEGGVIVGFYGIIILHQRWLLEIGIHLVTIMHALKMYDQHGYVYYLYQIELL